MGASLTAPLAQGATQGTVAFGRPQQSENLNAKRL